jgi:hypothetical protein
MVSDDNYLSRYTRSLTGPYRGDITVAERKAYISAMLCLMGKPSKLPAGQFPGAQNRYDDFVVVHVNQTLTIHGTVRNPFHWRHRCDADLSSGKLLVLAPLFHVGHGERS